MRARVLPHCVILSRLPSKGQRRRCARRGAFEPWSGAAPLHRVALPRGTVAQDPEVRSLDIWVVSKLASGAGKDHGTVFENVSVVGRPKPHGRRLPDQKDRRPVFAELARPSERSAGLEAAPSPWTAHPSGALRLGHEPARDGEHLLLATRERARELTATLAEDRQSLELALHGARAPGADYAGAGVEQLTISTL